MRTLVLDKQSIQLLHGKAILLMLHSLYKKVPIIQSFYNRSLEKVYGYEIRYMICPPWWLTIQCHQQNNNYFKST